MTLSLFFLVPRELRTSMQFDDMGADTIGGHGTMAFLAFFSQDHHSAQQYTALQVL